MNGLARSLAFPVSLALTVGTLGLGLLIGLDDGGEEAVPTTPTTTQRSGADGAEVFASQGCGACHTLSAADATGTVGPNLDETQLSSEQIQAVVANGRGGMPAFSDRLSEEEIAAVAAYVSEPPSSSP